MDVLSLWWSKDFGIPHENVNEFFDVPGRLENSVLEDSGELLFDFGEEHNNVERVKLEVFSQILVELELPQVHEFALVESLQNSGLDFVPFQQNGVFLVRMIVVGHHPLGIPMELDVVGEPVPVRAHLIFDPKFLGMTDAEPEQSRKSIGNHLYYKPIWVQYKSVFVVSFSTDQYFLM